jgi:hypothetical protein
MTRLGPPSQPGVAPPRTLESVLASLGAQPDFRDAVIGDLAEEFGEHAQRDGADAARRWYYREALRAIPHLVRSWARSVNRQELARVGGILVTAYTIVVIATVIAAGMARGLLASLGFSRTSPLPWSDPLLSAVMMIGLLMLGALWCVFAGYVVAWLDSRTPIIAATALVTVLACFGIVVSAVLHDSGNAHRFPVWFRCLASTVNMTATIAGAVVRVRWFNPCTDQTRSRQP